MTTAKPITVTANGLEFAALTWGDSSNKPILALHGWLDNASSFECLAPLLSTHYVVALDFAGHGHSAHRGAGTSYYVADYVVDAAHVARALGWQRFALLGHSLGAGVATMLAATQSEAIEKLILLDGVGPLTSAANRAADILQKAVTQSLAGTGTATTADTLDVLIERRQRATKYLEPEDVARLVQRSSQQEGGAWTWRYDQRLKLASPMRFDEGGVHAALGAIVCDILLITAKDGWIEAVPEFADRTSQLQQLEHHQVEGHHHLHMSSGCGQVAHYINKFLGARD